MNSSARTLRTAALAIAAIVAITSSSDALAGRKPEDVYAGKIITAKKRLPSSAKSVGAYLKKLRKLKKKSFWEDKKKKEWKIYFGAFFKRPLNDLEVTVKFYELSRGRPGRMIASYEQYLERRGQRTLLSKAVLERKFFGVNKEIYMTVENRGRVLAKTRFKILGEGPKYTGKVDFTEDEPEKKK